MKTIADSQLSSEFQELYLENKEWLTDIFFLEDETRFINKLLNDFFLPAVKQDHLQEMQAVQTKLQNIAERRTHLKTLIEKNQHMLESCMSEPESNTHLALIEDIARIQQEIKTLIKADSSLKRELFALVEVLMQKVKATHLLDKQ